MRLLYKPFGIIAGLIAARLGRSVFRSLWAKIDDAPPPIPGSGEGSVVKVVGSQALQAGVMAGSAAAVDRVFANVFHHLIGTWPKKPPEPEAESDSD
ncbi:MAG: DUF4235 domain-containing protein [Solirubrobacteraceae bacterium]